MYFHLYCNVENVFLFDELRHIVIIIIIIIIIIIFRVHGQSGQSHHPQEGITKTNIISKITVDFSVTFLNPSSFFHSFKIIVEEQPDFDKARANVDILQSGLLRLANF